jgi:hypothetical protein
MVQQLFVIFKIPIIKIQKIQKKQFKHHKNLILACFPHLVQVNIVPEKRNLCDLSGSEI